MKDFYESFTFGYIYLLIKSGQNLISIKTNGIAYNPAKHDSKLFPVINATKLINTSAITCNRFMIKIFIYLSPLC